MRKILATAVVAAAFTLSACSEEAAEDEAAALVGDTADAGGETADADGKPSDAAGGDASAAAADVDFGDDDSRWSNDGECDDPRFEGPGMTNTPLLDEDILNDATDCREAFERGDLTLKK